MRAKFQVLVLPFAVTENDVRYCVFKRPDMNFWQFVLGGGEDMETPFEAAVRKCRDEIGAENGNFYKLDSTASIPTNWVGERVRSAWGPDCIVISEYAFALKTEERDFLMSKEYAEFAWTDYKTALKMLRYGSNQTALYELNERIKLGLLERIH